MELSAEKQGLRKMQDIVMSERCEKDGKTLIVALLACGWPNNKGYKWSDTKKLMTYGMENYCYKEISPDKIDRTEKIYIKNGYTGGFPKKEKIF